MKALTLHEPYASLVAAGIKTIETRPFSTKYRGPLAIHAGKKFYVGPWSLELAQATNEVCGGIAGYPDSFPLGRVVAVCELVDVVPMSDLYMPTTKEPDRMASRRLLSTPRASWDIATNVPLGDFTRGRFAWMLHGIDPLVNQPEAVGKQGLWNWEL